MPREESQIPTRKGFLTRKATVIIQTASIYRILKEGVGRRRLGFGLEGIPETKSEGQQYAPPCFPAATPPFGSDDTQGGSKDLSGMGSVHAVGDTGIGLKTVSFPPFSVLPLGHVPAAIALCQAASTRRASL